MGTDSSSCDELCAICYARPVQVVFLPCDHACVCEHCLGRILEIGCPVCRSTINSVEFLSSNTVRDAAALIYEQQARDFQALAGTVQIAFVGPPKVGKKALIRRLCSMYPATAEKGSPEDSSMLSSLETASFAGQLSTTDFVTRLNDSTKSIYSPNATVSSTAVNMYAVSLPPHTPRAGRDVSEDIVNSLRADVVVFVWSFYRKAEIVELAKWDREVRLLRPELPRLWVFTKSDEQLHDSVDARDDITRLLSNGLSVEQHPKTRFVLRPHSRSTKTLRTCIKTVTRYGRSYHGMDPKPCLSSASRFLNWLSLRWTTEDAVMSVLNDG